MPRLDRRLRDEHPDLSWRQIREAIEQGQVTVNAGVERDPGFLVTAGAEVTLDRNRPARRHVRAPFPILYEDEDILVINKPSGLLTIPSSPALGEVEDTVLRRARAYAVQKTGRRSYVGMLHRIDRDTSGALAIALSKEAHAKGRELFKRHGFERRYLALVRGVPQPRQGTIRARISSTYRDGRRAVVDDAQHGLEAATDYSVRESFGDEAALVELRLHTGRQHQIRLHLERLGHPLLGEKVYTGKSSSRRTPANPPRTMLHARTLEFPHPITQARIAVDAPLPGDFARLLTHLRRATD